MSPIKAAFVVPENRCGSAAMLPFQIARRLHRREGFEAHLVAPGPGPLDRPAELAKLPIRHVEFGARPRAAAAASAPTAPVAAKPAGGGLLARLFGRKDAAAPASASGSLSSSAEDAAAVEALRRFLVEERFDVVHAARATFTTAAAAAKAAGIPYLFHLLEAEAELDGAPAASALALQQEAASAIFHVPASGITRCGAATSDPALAGKGRPLAIAVNNAVDLEHFARYDRKGCREDLNAEFSADKHGPIILFLGEISRQKGVDLLWEAAYDLFFRWPKMHFVLIGPDGPDADFVARVKATASASDFDDRFYFAGPKVDVAPYLTGATIFCLPTRCDAQPAALVEAMAAGIPIVTTDVGAIPALLKEGEIAFLHPPDDPQPIQEGIEKILSVADVRERYSQGGKARAQEFGFEPLVETVAATIRRIVG